MELSRETGSLVMTHAKQKAKANQNSSLDSSMALTVPAAIATAEMAVVHVCTEVRYCGVNFVGWHKYQVRCDSRAPRRWDA